MTPSTGAEPDTAPREGPDPVRILVVDDERANLKLLSTALGQEGLEVTCADGGRSALQVCRTRPPDLVLLDISMPGMDGFQVLEAVRDLEGCRSIPVIFLSGMEDITSKLRGFSLGAVDYVVKPFHLEEVRARVRIHLQLSATRRALAQEQSRRLDSLARVQRSIMTQPRDLPLARFATHFRPAQEAGGDFFDVLELGQGIHGYFVGDVSGHDLGTSLVASGSLALLRQNAGPAWAPEDTFRMVNGALCQWLPPGRFLTGMYVRLNRNTLTIRAVAAAHPPLAILGRDGRVAFLEGRGDVLGSFPDGRFDPFERRVKPGDRILMYTDGLLEGTGLGLRQSLERMDSILAELAGESLAELPASLAEAMGAQKSSDDVLILAFEV